MDYAALKTEITTDPVARGYAAPYAAGDDAAVAALLNAVNPAISITIPLYSREEFMTGILPAVLALGSATAAVQAKWDRLLSVTRSMGVIHYSVAAPVLEQLAADGLITQAQIAAFTIRHASRAEALFGFGAAVALTDVSKTRSI